MNNRINLTNTNKPLHFIVVGIIVIVLGFIIYSIINPNISISKEVFKGRVDKLFTINSPPPIQIMSAKDNGLAIDDYAENVIAKYEPTDYSKLKEILKADNWELLPRNYYQKVFTSNKLYDDGKNFNQFICFLNDSLNTFEISFIHE